MVQFVVVVVVVCVGYDSPPIFGLREYSHFVLPLLSGLHRPRLQGAAAQDYITVIKFIWNRVCFSSRSFGLQDSSWVIFRAVSSTHDEYADTQVSELTIQAIIINKFNMF